MSDRSASTGAEAVPTAESASTTRGFHKCPLCGCAGLHAQDQIRTGDLARVYQRVLGLDVRAELGETDLVWFVTCPSCHLEFFDPPLAGSECFYEQLQRFPWYYPDEKAEYDFAGRFVGPTDSVLEIGCGKGAFARLVSARCYVGLELSRRAVEMGRDAGLDIRCEAVEAHAEDHAAAYDLVCAFQVLEHVAQPGAFLRAAAACVRPEGLLVISVPSADSFLSEVVNGALNLPPHHVTRWSDRALRGIAEPLNLELVALEHEPLARMHVQWWSMTRATDAVGRLMRAPRKLVDVSPAAVARSRMGTLLAPLFRWRAWQGAERPRGHSVTAVYRRRLHADP